MFVYMFIPLLNHSNILYVSTTIPNHYTDFNYSKPSVIRYVLLWLFCIWFVFDLLFFCYVLPSWDQAQIQALDPAPIWEPGPRLGPPMSTFVQYVPTLLHMNAMFSLPDFEIVECAWWHMIGFYCPRCLFVCLHRFPTHQVYMLSYIPEKAGNISSQPALPWAKPAPRIIMLSPSPPPTWPKLDTIWKDVINNCHLWQTHWIV